MTDNYSGYQEGLDSPAGEALAVTPSDTVDLDESSRALYIGGAGNVALITVGGTTCTFAGLVAGSILPVRTKRVLVAGTTATDIVALY